MAGFIGWKKANPEVGFFTHLSVLSLWAITRSVDARALVENPRCNEDQQLCFVRGIRF